MPCKKSPTGSDADAAAMFRGHSRYVAHGLGNLLTGLHLSLELLQQTDLSPAGARYLGRSLELLQRLHDEKDLLAALGGATIAPPTWTPLLPLVEAARDRFATADDLTFETDLADGAAQVLAHPFLLREALLLLVRNATDALPAGGRLGVRARPVPGATPAVEVVVWDHGQGLAPALLAPAARLGRVPYSGKPYGNGMGLVVARAITEELHGGRLRVRAGSPQGSEVSLLLPSPAPAP